MSKVLDLAVLDRDTVKMPDGTTYELRKPQEFGIVDDHKLRTLIEKITKASTSTKKPTEQDAEAAAQMLRDLATMLVVDLQGEIPDWACVAIFEFWVGEAPEGNPPPPARKPASPRKPKTRTTVGSSRSSKRSTAATRKRGSTSRGTS